ncbi:MAG TPA: hypothetical protein VGQ37_18755 [Vicinamibacterales bacterium]|jgi:hypothetical protein|nr:hypothetical protein [Vicinamibacterales bacterium]
MQRRLTVSLVALQLVVACGYAVSAQDAKRPSYARSSAARDTTAALAVARARAAAVAPADTPGDELTLRMTPRFVSAPGYLRSLIRVAPNADNRILRVEIDSDAYYRSSDIELDGASAPMSHFMDWKEVPAGKYDLIVTVMGPSGPRVVRRLNFQVLGMTTEP